MCKAWKRTKRKKRKEIKGYFTVEAAMIIPTVIFLMAMVFYLSFYLYNRCIVSQDAYILAFRGSTLCKAGEDEVEQHINKESIKLFRKKYMGITVPDIKITVNGKNVTVLAEGKMKASSFGLPVSKKWFFGTEKQVQRMCPVECIRKVRIIKSIYEKINEK